MEFNFSINSVLTKNHNLTDEEVTMLGTGLSSIYYFISEKYGIDINYDNIVNIMSSIKFEKIRDENIPDFVTYNRIDNKIVKKCSPGNSSLIYEYYRCLFEIISQRYNDELKRYESGLIYEDSVGNKYGERLNNILISRLTTLITDLDDPKQVDPYFYDEVSPYNLNDIVMGDLIEVLGLYNLLESFLTANGEDLFCRISQTLGSDTVAKDFYSSIDNYDEDRIENRKKYNYYINLLKENKLEDVPKI